jgi:hypothetical protein
MYVSRQKPHLEAARLLSWPPRSQASVLAWLMVLAHLQYSLTSCVKVSVIDASYLAKHSASALLRHGLVNSTSVS